MGRIFGFMGILCLILIGVSSRFPYLFRELTAAVERGRFELTEPNRKKFLAKTLQEVNRLRTPLSLKPMSIDRDIQDALTDVLNLQNDPDDLVLQDLFTHLQDRFPGAQFLSANVSHSLTDVGLIESIAMWEDVTSSDYESISSVLFVNGHRLGCISVLAKRLPEFNVTAANKLGGRYFNRCPHCKLTHAVELKKKSRTLVLACPDCNQAYDVLAADTHGVFYRANDFLLGFKLPHVVGIDEDEMSKPSEKLLLHIWRTVVNHCEYQNDASRTAQREAWKTPDQTWLERAGDCEDTSILLVDSLISAGFEARVAVGWNTQIGQHAWCVAKVGNKQYVMESTIQDGKNVRLLSAEDAAAEYSPEQLFDRDHLYFRTTAKEMTLNDYWGDNTWKAVEFLVQPPITRFDPEIIGAN